MRLWNPFKRKSDKPKDETGLEPNQIKEPAEYEGFMSRGWALHSMGEHEKAESDFRTAIVYSPESIDAIYALGLVMKAQKKKEEAIELFEKCLRLIEQGKIEDQSRSEMMRRLTQGYINELTTGDWNLEEHIWRQIE